MTANLAYLGYVLKHKWFVFVAGRRLGVPLRRLLAHDLSKFSRAEWRPYVDRFNRGVPKGPAFRAAFRHHWHANDHHWQFWLGEHGEPREMTEEAAREMVADWIGAGRTKAKRKGATAREWYFENEERIRLHESTRALVEKLLNAPRMRRRTAGHS